MIAFIATALAAGAASALMFASLASGEPIALVLVVLAPLPLMVAGLSWGPLSASIGGIAAATAIGALFGIDQCISFAMTVAVPAWWLGHLVLLGRPAADAAVPTAETTAPDVEWYPLGRTVVWIVAIAALTTAMALLMRGLDADVINSALHRSISGEFENAGIPASAETEQLIDALTVIGPTLAVAFATIRLTIALWLAAKIAAVSGRLRRPWPDLKDTRLPSMTLVALFAAVAFSFPGGLLALLAKVAASAVLMAYALTGFAVLHTLTLSRKGRAGWLGLIYASVALLWWPLLAVIALGLADAAFGLRQRFWQRQQPPPLPAP